MWRSKRGRGRGRWLRGFAVAAVALVTATGLSGCASLLSAALPESAPPGPRPLQLSYLPAVQGKTKGIEIVAQPRSAPWVVDPRDLGRRLGWWGDLLVGANIALLVGTYRNPADAYLTASVAGLALYGADAIAGADNRADWLHRDRLGSTLGGLLGVTGLWWLLSRAASGDNTTPETVLLPVPVFLGLHFLLARAPAIFQSPPAPGSPLADCADSLTYAYSNGTGFRYLALARAGDTYRGFLPATRQDLDVASAYAIKCGGVAIQSDPMTLASADWARHLGRKVVDAPDDPPVLATAVDLVDPLGEQAIHAAVGGELVLTVTNSGRGPAQDAVATLALATKVNGLTLPAEVELGDILPGKSRTVRIPVGAARSIADSTVDMRIAVKDAADFDAAPLPVRFRTEALRVADFVAEEVGAESQDGALLVRGVPLEVRVRLRNKGRGPSKGGKAILSAADGAIAVLDGATDVGDVAPGASKVATFSILVQHAYAGPRRLELALDLRDGNPEAERTVPAGVTLHQERAAVRSIRFERRERLAASGMDPGTDVGGGGAGDIDRPLPARRPVRPGAVALLVGVERYRDGRIPAVPYVRRDVAALKAVTLGLLGVAPDNLLVLQDEQATKGQIETAVEEKIRALVDPGRSDVYVYFAGHGTVDPDGGLPYLVGYDSESGLPRSGYAIGQLLRSLGAAGARSVTVMLDAGFNGLASRDERGVSLLAGSRPIGLQALAEGAWRVPAGVTVLAAGKPDQSALAYPARRHGLFSYHLIKGLRDAAGKEEAVTAASLHDYIGREVSHLARRFDQFQEPQLRGPGGAPLLERPKGGQ